MPSRSSETGGREVNPASEWVVYFPLKSVSFGHASVPRDPRRALAVLQDFLLTETKFKLSSQVKLHVWRGKFVDETIASERISEARVMFGPETSTIPIGSIWELGSEILETMTIFALDDQKFPKQELGPCNVTFSYRFDWTQTESLHQSAATFGDHYKENYIVVDVGGKSLFLQPMLIFPQPYSSSALHEFIGRIEPKLPFRLREKHFRRLVMTRSGTRKLAKLDPEWRVITRR